MSFGLISQIVMVPFEDEVVEDEMSKQKTSPYYGLYLQLSKSN